MLLQEEAGQFLAKQAGQVLPLGERDQLLLVGLGEHALERLPGAEQPAFTQGLPLLAMQKSATFRGVSPKKGLKVRTADWESC